MGKFGKFFMVSFGKFLVFRGLFFSVSWLIGQVCAAWKILTKKDRDCYKKIEQQPFRTVLNLGLCHFAASVVV